MRRTIHRVLLERAMHTRRRVRGKRTGVCHGTAQVFIGVGVAPRKMRTCQPKNILDLLCEHTLRQQLPGDPQIDDAPVGWSESLSDGPSARPPLVDLHGLCRLDAGWSHRELSRGETQLALRDSTIEPLTRKCWCVRSRRRQGVRIASQTSGGVYDFHPG